MLVSAGRRGDHDIWAPVSDLMAALMLIFMFIAVVYVRSVVDEQTANQEECDKIYRELDTEFGNDFDRWDVELLDDLTIRFRNPEILFASESDEIRPRFEEILRSFFPRYMRLVQSSDYRTDIRELRVEGHTSSAWVGAVDEDERYFKNMELSHQRTQAILEFVMALPEAAEYREWAKGRITASGLSSSRVIRDATGREDARRSRRVEFRLLASSCQRAGVYDRQEAAGNDGG